MGRFSVRSGILLAPRATLFPRSLLLKLIRMIPPPVFISAPSCGTAATGIGAADACLPEALGKSLYLDSRHTDRYFQSSAGSVG